MRAPSRHTHTHTWEQLVFAATAKPEHISICEESELRQTPRILAVAEKRGEVSARLAASVSSRRRPSYLCNSSGAPRVDGKLRQKSRVLLLLLLFVLKVYANSFQVFVRAAASSSNKLLSLPERQTTSSCPSPTPGPFIIVIIIIIIIISSSSISLRILSDAWCLA